MSPLIKDILWVFFVAAALIIGLDVLAAAKGGEQATLSIWITAESKKRPIIPALLCLVIGILIGHFWWQNGCP